MLHYESNIILCRRHLNTVYTAAYIGRFYYIIETC